MKKVFLDTETTGLNPVKNGIWQISGFIRINGETKESFDYKMNPPEGTEFEDKALEMNNLTIDILKSFPSSQHMFNEFKLLLGKYIDRYDKKDKFFLYAYNAQFDSNFVRQWFLSHGDKYYGSLFFNPAIDVMSLAAEKLIEHRPLMPNFQLSTVAMELGIDEYDEKLHDALYDSKYCMNIYDKLKLL